VTKFFQKNIKKAGKIEGNHTEKILDLISVRSLKIESIINEKYIVFMCFSCSLGVTYQQICVFSTRQI